MAIVYPPPHPVKNQEVRLFLGDKEPKTYQIKGYITPRSKDSVFAVFVDEFGETKVLEY